MIVTIRRTYKYPLYRNSKRERHLHDTINIAGIIWNHSVALQRRYYHLTGDYISLSRLKHHIAKLRMQTHRYVFWQKVGSQAVQDVLERLDKSYQRFFARQGGLPRFRKVKKFRSFTLKQAGWKLMDCDKKKRGIIHIQGRDYKFVKHRETQGIIKTATIKRDNCNRLWLCFSVKEKLIIPETSSGKIGGFDFGLKIFLTDHHGASYISQEYLRQELSRIRSLAQSVSRKRHGSHNQKKTRWLLNRTHIRVADKRLDAHFQLSHDLCDRFSVLIFEDLNIASMKRLWGRKVSDLGFAQFLQIMEWVAFKRGKKVIQINRFEPTSQMCSGCGYRQKLTLKQRIFDCPACGLSLNRDHNAAKNIKRIGTSIHTNLGDIRPDLSGISV